jgi:regulatory protein
MSREALESSAVAYLARFSTSAGNLRRVLARKILRSARHYGDDPAPLMAAVDAIVARFVAQGAIDDAHYAGVQLRALRRRGGSSQAIRGRLAAKGLDSSTIDAALSEHEPAAADLAAAVILARRRRLGPFRTTGRAENRQRDLAVLGRAGFDYQTAAQVIDAPEIKTFARACDD